MGVLSDPSEYFDKVHTLSDWENQCKNADAIAAIIQIQMDADRGVRKETKYPSSKMKDVIDVGSLPDHLKDKA